MNLEWVCPTFGDAARFLATLPLIGIWFFIAKRVLEEERPETDGSEACSGPARGIRTC